MHSAAHYPKHNTNPVMFAGPALILLLKTLCGLTAIAGFLRPHRLLMWFHQCFDRSAYREFVCQEDDETDNIIRRATNSSRPFGSETFIDMLEFQLNQTLKLGKPGRPRKENRGVFD